jgi:hypothetical protein
MKKRIALAALIVVAILGVLSLVERRWLLAKYDDFTVVLPTYPPIENVTWLDQNWTPEQRDWFHHADQGTQTFGIPYEWFIALEQPSLSLTAPGLMGDPEYLDRYGFIPYNASPGKPELPIGFAHGGQILNVSGAALRNHQTNAEMT